MSCWIKIGKGKDARDCYNGRRYGFATCGKHKHFEGEERCLEAIRSKPERAEILAAENGKTVSSSPASSMVVAEQVAAPVPHVVNHYIVHNHHHVANNLYQTINICLFSFKEGAKKGSAWNLDENTGKHIRAVLKSTKTAREYRDERIEKCQQRQLTKRSEMLSDRRGLLAIKP